MNGKIFQWSSYNDPLMSSFGHVKRKEIFRAWKFKRSKLNNCSVYLEVFGTDCIDKAEKTDSDTMLSNKLKNCWALFSQEGFFGMHSFWNELVQTVKVSQDVHCEKKLGNAKKLNFAYLCFFTH